MKVNRLSKESSPYLRQHADNPVDWYPWCEEAFERAQKEDKPVFLSIGYSTCHWCHVMAHESFEDEQIAKLLNEHFIAVKVDREERPDVDNVYMSVCQALTGQGGWPLSVFMTPDKKPFYAGTYFPPRQRGHFQGFYELLEQIQQMWQEERDTLTAAGSEVSALFERRKAKPSGQVEAEALIRQTFLQLRDAYDERYGGFGGAPKFPQPQNILFLLEYAQVYDDKTALEMASSTLKHMYRGGLFDHIGYGFSRYSTDEKWLAPHFEKMLYDNAMLLMCYVKAYEATKEPFYLDVACKTATYIQREMTDENGGFYTAQDADSEGEEGRYYVFEPCEIVRVLGAEDGAYFNAYFNITEQGNFEGRNILNLIDNEKYAEKDARIEEAVEKLYAYRKQRYSLHRDEKVLTGLNALMIAALAQLYRTTLEEEYLKGAVRAEKRIAKAIADSGQVCTYACGAGAATAGFLDDYAFYAYALLELYRATFQADYLDRALSVQQEIVQRFRDENGGYYMSAEDAERLIFRPMETFDNAMPSGNSVAAMNLVWLSLLTAQPEIIEEKEKHLTFMKSKAAAYAMGNGFFSYALLKETYAGKQLVCVLPEGADIEELLSQTNNIFTVIVKFGENKIAAAPFTDSHEMLEGKCTYYLCENYTCQAPTHNIEKLVRS